MKNILIATFTLLSLSVSGLASPESQKLESQVLKANSDFFRAIDTMNVELLDKVVADDLIIPYGDNEKYATKKDLKVNLVSEKLRPETRTRLQNYKVTATKIYGNTAVVIGRLWAPDKRFPKFNGHRAFTNVFTLTEENDWEIVTFFHSEIKKSQ